MKLRELTQSMKSAGEKALVPFFTAGYPDEETFRLLLDRASRKGCRIVEIGIPFSDPIADGPIIQESSRHALENGISLRKALSLVEQAAQASSTAFVLMSYANPILRMGLERFAHLARSSGVLGVIIPDVPLEESAQFRQVLQAEGVTLVDLVAPTSSCERIGCIAGAAEGFLYLVSLTGVTGIRSALTAHLGGFVSRVRAQTDLPLYVGFGVSTREQAVEVAKCADGVIIGSALIKIIQSSPSNGEAVD
jgi:tryptophan synthase alpha chain